MTVQTTTSRADYTGNGSTTAFTIPFYFLDNTHIKVLRTQISTGAITTLALTTDYTVTGAGVGAGGTATMLVAPTSDQKISILRNVPLTQLIHYVPNDPFPAATHEQALDQLTMEVQQLYENISRALTLPANTSDVSAALPTPVANYIFGFDATGTLIQLYSPASLLSVAGSSGFSFNTFNGDGSTKIFTLSGTPGAIANTEVFVGGSLKVPTIDYTVSGATLTFVSAPTTGTNNILVRWGQTLGISIPSDTSVTTAKIADANVTYAKLQNVSATAKIHGRKTAGAGVLEECSLSDILDFIGSAAQGDILYRAASSWARLPAGTSGQALVSGGAGANPSWGSAGAMVLLSTQTASASSTIEFSSLLSSTYKKYIVEFIDAVASTAGSNIYVRVKLSNVTRSTAGDYQYVTYFARSGFSANSGSTSATEMRCGSSSNTNPINGYCTIYNPAGSGLNKFMQGRVTTINSTPDICEDIFAGVFQGSTAALDGLTILMSAGNISSGTFKLYGVL